MLQAFRKHARFKNSSCLLISLSTSVQPTNSLVAFNFLAIDSRSLVLDVIEKLID